jgi:AAA family ATP:ADP antiporter
MVLSFIQSLLKPFFGTFEKEEFKKFLRMGLTFTLVIGAYWTLRTLKNATFCSLLGPTAIPTAKIASLVCLFPLLMIYTKLLDSLNREKMFYVLSIIYGLATIVFAFLIVSKTFGQDPCLTTAAVASRTGWAAIGTNLLGYGWYIFVESYGSLIIALFWAIASDTTKPASAKQGFYLVTCIGQVGGILGPKYIPKLPRLLGYTTNSLAIGACAAIILLSILSIRSFFKKTPANLLASYHGKGEAKKEDEQEPGFFEGLKLLVTTKYLLGIFAVLSFFEIIVTIFDFHFQTMAAMTYSGTQLSEYIGSYGSMVNLVTFLCLLFGISNVPKYLGITTSLVLMPIIIGGAVMGFFTLDSLGFLFYLMVGSKALNYALNGPAIKQLYIPTTHDVRFKAQAWVETFGSRGSKGAGSGFNMLLAPLQKQMGAIAGRVQHVVYSSYLGFAVVGLWLIIALFLGKTYKKAVDNNEVVC